MWGMENLNRVSHFFLALEYVFVIVSHGKLDFIRQHFCETPKISGKHFIDHALQSFFVIGIMFVRSTHQSLVMGILGQAV